MIVIYISLAFLSRAKDSQQYVRWCADIHIFLFLRTGRPPHYYNSYSSCSQAMPTRSNNCSTASGRRPAVASIRKIRSQSSKSKLHRLIAATDLNTLAACCTSAFVCTPVLNINISVTIISPFVAFHHHRFFYPVRRPYPPSNGILSAYTHVHAPCPPRLFDQTCGASLFSAMAGRPFLAHHHRNQTKFYTKGRVLTTAIG